MKPQELTNFINSPETLDVNTLPKIIELAKQYPYCQIGHLLLSKNLYNNGSPDYNKYIHKAASYAGSRKNFHTLIYSLKESSEIKKNTEPVQFQPNINSEDKPIIENKHIEPIVKKEEAPIIEDIKTIPEIIQPTHSSVSISTNEADKKAEYQKQLKLRLAEIAQESKFKNTSTNNTFINKENTTQSELIDKFIKEEPRIVPQNKEIINKEDLSEKSSLDNSEIISETLAQIYEKQGNFEKAIKTYEKLSLKFPEKSTYFATQIEKIKNNHKY